VVKKETLKPRNRRLTFWCLFSPRLCVSAVKKLLGVLSVSVSLW